MSGPWPLQGISSKAGEQDSRFRQQAQLSQGCRTFQSIRDESVEQLSVSAHPLRPLVVPGDFPARPGSRSKDFKHPLVGFDSLSEHNSQNPARHTEPGNLLGVSFPTAFSVKEANLCRGYQASATYPALRFSQPLSEFRSPKPSRPISDDTTLGIRPSGDSPLKAP